MLKTYTQRGRAWEILNSWWMLLTLAPFGSASFLAFLYIGFQVKKPLWKLCGWVYLAGFSAAVALIVAELGGMAEGIGTAIAMVAWIVSFVHVFRVRPAFLIQFDVYQAGVKGRNEQKLSKVRKEAEAKFQTAGSRAQFKPPAPKPKAETAVETAETNPPEGNGSPSEGDPTGQRIERETDASAPPVNTVGPISGGRRVDY